MSTKPIKLNKDVEDLFSAFSKIRTAQERKNFFLDLLTEEELKDIARRLKVAKMLSDKIPFTKIEQETKMSSTTIARISKWLKSGYGGMSIIIKKAKK